MPAIGSGSRPTLYPEPIDPEAVHDHAHAAPQPLVQTLQITPF